MKYDCELIQDLLPLYRDRITSPKTNEIIAAHLEECPECRKLFSEPEKPAFDLNEEPVEQSPNVVSYGRRIKARRRKIKSVVAIVIATLLLVIGVMSVFIYYVVWGGPATVTHNAADYGNFEDFKGYSNLYVFPARLPASMQIQNYYYFYQDTFLDPTYQIYLEYTLSDADYQAEVQRLASITEQHGSETHPIVYDTQNFSYPAYVTVFENNLTYEYALLIENQRKIVCVFSQFVNRNDIKFDPAYLPRKFKSAGDSGSTTQGGFNIYYFSIDDSASTMDRKIRKKE
jgi:hypothetical protein